MKNINVKQTRCNTRDFLRNKLDHYLNYCNRKRESIYSLDVKNTKVDASLNTDLANQYVEIFYSQKIVSCVADALNNCTQTTGKPYKKFLTDRYLHLLNMEDIDIKYSFSRSTATRMDNKALLEFADKFLFSQLINQVCPVIDLHIYQKKKDIT